MRLKVTLARQGSESVDVAVTVDGSVTVGDLATMLERSDPESKISPRPGSVSTLRLHPGPRVSAASVLVADSPLASSGLRSGATVSLAVQSERFRAAGSDRGPAAATLRVLAGPDVGKEFALAEGTTYVGRQQDCEIRLTDPLVSKRHARITVTDVVEVVDIGSANGVVIGGNPVTRGVVGSQDRIILGDTSVSITAHRPVSHGAGQTADVDFNRSPRLDPSYRGETFVAPDPPELQRPHRFPTIAAVVPLIMGAVMFAVTRSALSVVFVALSPLLMIANYVDQLIQTRRMTSAADARFTEAVRALRDNLTVALAEEAAGRLAESPSTADTLDAVLRQTPLLWTRRVEHDRFMTVRFGTGTMPSRQVVELPSNNRGSASHWAQLAAVARSALTVAGVPVVADFADCGSVGVAGPRGAAVGVTRGLVAQCIALHSPADLTVAAITSADSAADWMWLKWLPHVGGPHSALRRAQLGADAGVGTQIVADVEELIAERARQRSVTDARALPVVLLIVEDDSPVERARLVVIAEEGPSVGVHLIWVASAQERLPAACRSFVVVDGVSGAVTAGFVRTAHGVTPVVCETVDRDRAGEAARSLAPVVDSGARADDDSDLPRSVSFLSIVGSDLATDPGAVIDRWHETLSISPRGGAAPIRRRTTGLRAVVGQAAGEPMTLDLHSQGPHALVGGTTGAGKSEFLQSWVLGMAAAYSPDLLTFLLIDYKGGAAFADCKHLPHTVGLVTDLSPHLVRRALTSLNAEVKHREHVLNAKKAKDLVKLHELGDIDAPPRLVIVVDEFAALAAEVPDFVDGMINVAQRGRSLGLHLILATQRPAGVIRDNLRANTNLRIALRMADEGDSTDVLGVPLAAGFSPDIPGRGAAKTGPGRISGFQTAYAGGWTAAEPPPPTLEVRELAFGVGRRWELPEDVQPDADDLGPNDIARLVTTITAAALRAGVPAPRKPWLPELSDRYDLQFLGQRRDTELVIGVIDDPDNQDQHTVHFQPDVDGNMAIYGTGGAGKSAALRTLASAAGITPRSGPCQVYGLDFGSSGLRMLEVLPHVGSIISGDDDERVGRLIRWLRGVIDARRGSFAAVQAGTITEYRERSGRPDEPRILLLLDGMGAFKEAYESRYSDGVFSGLLQIAADGRPLGVHVIITADRSGSVPVSLASSMQRRLVLRLADESDYSFLNVESDILGPRSAPGRGVLDGQEVQVALLGGSPSVPAQARELEMLSRTLAKHAVPAPPIPRLPDVVRLADLPVSRGVDPAIGIGGDDVVPVTMTASGAWLITGPPQSGRSTVLLALVTSVHRAHSGAEFTFFGRVSPMLESFDAWRRVPPAESDIISRAAALTELIDAGQGSGLHHVVVIERIGEQSGPVGQALAKLVEACRRNGQLAFGESEVSALGFGDLIKPFKADRRGVLLQPDSGDGENLLKTPLPPKMRRSDFPVGRGFLIGGGRAIRVQFALPE